MNNTTERKPTKIQMSAYDTKVTYELPYSDTNIYEMINGVVTCLYGLGWLKNTIIEGMKEFIFENSDD